MTYKKKYSVLHIITHLEVGGAQDNTLYTLEKINRNKFNITLAANLSGEFLNRAESIYDLKLIHIPSLQTKVRPLYDIISLIYLVKIIKTGQYDIIHTHSTKPGVLGRIASTITRTPLIVHTVHGFAFHDFMPVIQRKILISVEKWMNLLSDHLIAVSKLNIKKMLKLNLTKSHLVTNIYSGIDLNKFNNRNYNQKIIDELKLTSGYKLVGFIGRYSNQKDPLCLLAAVNNLIKEFSNVHFLFVGGGDLKAEMVDYISQNDLNKYVTIWDYREDIIQILDSLDLFVISSIYEGIGRSLTEAMAKGIPVVATNVEGIPEIVIKNKTGRLVPPRSPELLAKAMKDALINNKKSKTLAQIGQKQIREHFDVDEMVRKIEKVYEEQLSKKI